MCDVEKANKLPFFDILKENCFETQLTLTLAETQIKAIFGKISVDADKKEFSKNFHALFRRSLNLNKGLIKYFNHGKLETGDLNEMNENTKESVINLIRKNRTYDAKNSEERFTAVIVNCLKNGFNLLEDLPDDALVHREP